MASTTTATVLLVQPERDERDMYVEYLVYEGFEVVPVSTASEALIVAPRADAIVSGILLPGQMDGIEFVSRIKHDERTRRIPVVVLTACAWKDDSNRACADGRDVFLAKPCLPDVLAREIRRLLALRDVPRAHPAIVAPPLKPRFRRTS